MRSMGKDARPGGAEGRQAVETRSALFSRIALQLTESGAAGTYLYRRPVTTGKGTSNSLQRQLLYFTYIIPVPYIYYFNGLGEDWR